MSDLPDYTPPKVWTWDSANGGEFASINRPIAGVAHDFDGTLGGTLRSAAGSTTNAVTALELEDTARTTSTGNGNVTVTTVLVAEQQ